MKTLGLLGNDGAVHFDLDLVVLAVVDQGDEIVGLFGAVQRQAADGGVGAVVVDGDVIEGLAIAVVDLELGPIGGQARGDAQLVDFDVQAQQRLDDQPVHPAGRSGVPRPAAAARVRLDAIDVGGHDIRLDSVLGSLRRRRAVRDGVDQPEQLPRPLAVPPRGRGHDGPNGAMRVLASVFPHAGYVAFDVARIQIRFVERRIEQQDQTVVPADQPAIDAGHRGFGPLRRAGAGKYRPALRDGVDLTFFVLGRAQWRAVVEVRPAIPLAVPAVLVDASTQSAGFAGVRSCVRCSSDVN